MEKGESKTQISVLITTTARELLVQHSAGPHAIGYELDRIIKAAYREEKKVKHMEGEDAPRTN